MSETMTILSIWYMAPPLAYYITCASEVLSFSISELASEVRALPFLEEGRH